MVFLFPRVLSCLLNTEGLNPLTVHTAELACSLLLPNYMGPHHWTWQHPFYSVLKELSQPQLGQEKCPTASILLWL